MNIITYGCLQLCLCLVDKANSHEARVYRFERTGREWALLESYPAVVGRKGISWAKREGDLKTPAGVFRFGPVFGAEKVKLQMSYIQVVKGLEAVDDPKSLYYNKILFGSPDKDWVSAEDMTHELYKWGIVVEHNMNPSIPYLGSCIFYHLWRGPDEGTAGCTAMEESNLVKLIYWLNPAKKPLLVQLSANEYVKYALPWGLPAM